jgi:hypothetical protein
MAAVLGHGREMAGRCSTASAAARHGELEELLFLGVHGRGKMQGCRERNSPRGGAARGRDVQSMGDRTHGGGRPSIWERGVQRHGGRGKLATMGGESSCAHRRKDPCTERHGEEGRWAEVPRRECGAMDREQRYPRPWSRKGARHHWSLELGSMLAAVCLLNKGEESCA